MGKKNWRFEVEKLDNLAFILNIHIMITRKVFLSFYMTEISTEQFLTDVSILEDHKYL